MERCLPASSIMYAGPSGDGGCAKDAGLCVSSAARAGPSRLVWSNVAGSGESATCTGTGLGGLSVSVPGSSAPMVSLAIVGRLSPGHGVALSGPSLVWLSTEMPGRSSRLGGCRDVIWSKFSVVCSSSVSVRSRNLRPPGWPSYVAMWWIRSTVDGVIGSSAHWWRRMTAPVLRLKKRAT